MRSRAAQRALVTGVKAYRLLLSPWLGNACRFYPTCSSYALEALERHGAARGSYLTLRRIARCHPGCAGGFDPVPMPVASVHLFASSVLALPDALPDFPSATRGVSHETPPANTVKTTP